MEGNNNNNNNNNNDDEDDDDGTIFAFLSGLFCCYVSFVFVFLF